MTDLLERAFAEASKLPADQQDRLAQWLLDELADDVLWDERLAGTTDALSRLAREAHEEHKAGETQDLDSSLQ
jgi:hypothetical protein